MSWARLDDKMVFHRKVVAAGNEAVGAWVRALSWCSEQMSDGVIPWNVATMIASKKTFLKLISVGLCDLTDNPEAIAIHDYLAYNPSKADVERKIAETHEIKRKAGLLGAQRRWGIRAETDGTCHGSCHPSANGRKMANHSPIPSHPIPSHPEEGERESAEREIGALPQTPPAPTSSTPVQPPSVGDSQTSLPGLAHAQPTPPAPKPAKKAAKGSNGADRTTRLPEGFAPSEQHRSLAKEFDVDLGVVFPKFVDHHRAKGSRFIDWDAALRNWIRTSNSYDRVGPTRKPAPRESNLPDVDDIIAERNRRNANTSK